MIVDLDFYTNVYKEIATDDFDKLNVASQSIIEYLTLKGGTTLSNSPFLVNIKNAICSQIEYLSQNGSLKALQGQNTGDFKSESIGSYSYTRNNKNSDITYLNGIPVAPMVFTYLMPTGLLYCGVPCSGIRQ